MRTFADTNVLLAFILEDRSPQRAPIEAYVEQRGPLVVTESVLAEACWVLVRTCARPATEVAKRLGRLLESSTFDAWDDDLARTALALLFRHPHLGLPDCLLAARATLGDAVFTFDRRLAQTIERL